MPETTTFNEGRARQIIAKHLSLEGPLLPGETTLHARVNDRVAPGVVYTTFHHPDTQANVVTTDFSDWATNCPEFKVTAVQVSASNGLSEWQEHYRELWEQNSRIAGAVEAAE